MKPFTLAPSSSFAAITLFTFNVALQLAVFPHASVTVITTVCDPGATGVPAAGTCVMLNPEASEALSLTTTPALKSGTRA